MAKIRRALDDNDITDEFDAAQEFTTKRKTKKQTQIQEREIEEQEQASSGPQDIEGAFADMQNKNDMAEVLKELFDEKKIYMIGDMSKDEIKLATRIYMIARIKKIDIWIEGLAFYAKFLISKDRKSRSEILRAIAGYQQPQGLMGKLGGMFNRDRGY